MATARLSQFELVASGSIPDVPYMALLGMRMTAIGGGAATVEMAVDLARLRNPLGVLHGGATTSLADHAMGMAFLSILEDDETFGTVELKMNLVKAIREPCILVAQANVVTVGRTIGIVDVSVTRVGDGALIARGTSTCMRMKASKPSPIVSLPHATEQ